MNTKIAVLGAGCSHSCGYPLANQMKDHLRDFAESVKTSAPKLHKLACDTVGLFDKLAAQGCPAQTIDDLAWLIHQHKIPVKSGTFKDEQAYRLVEEAKTVVSAMFLAKENDSTAKSLAGYRNLLRRIFPNGTR